MSAKMAVSRQYRTDVDGTRRRRGTVRTDVTQTVEREACEVPGSDHCESGDAPVAPLRSLELFTGAGGLALGTHAAGFHHVALMEWNEDACATLRHNVASGAVKGIEGWRVRREDVRSVDFTPFTDADLLAGGVPCQPFSVGGKHLGMDDERNLFPDFVRAVRTIKPRAFIIENVKGLLRDSFRPYFTYILLQLTHPEVARRKSETWAEHLCRLGKIKDDSSQYRVSFRLLNAADYGVPQTRQRVFIVGFRSDLAPTWQFPTPTHSYDALMRDQWATGAYWKRHNLSVPKVKPSYAGSTIQSVMTLPWATIRDAICDLPRPRTDREAAGVLNHRLNPGGKTYTGHTGSPLDLPSKTLKAGVHGVPGGENMIVMPDDSVRYLTVREAARVQTFPDAWWFEGAWSEAMRQLGNAVPVRLAETVARSVADGLRGR